MRLNKKGKVLSAILSVLVVVLIAGFFIANKTKQETAPIHTTSLETLPVSFEPIGGFEESPLRQSILLDERQKKEIARKEAVAKQNVMDQQEKAIYLTFDDGPSAVADQLLDILDAYQMKATFFMLGPNMKEHSKAVVRMKNEGFGLALHGITHEAGEIYSSASAPADEMIEDRQILKDVTGVQSNLIRLPYGSIPYLTEDMRYVLDQNDFQVWDWNVDSRDWELKDRRYVEHTKKAIDEYMNAGVTPVVLLHDKPHTIEFLPELLSYIKKQGYKTKVLTNEQPPVTFPCNGRCQSIS
ncbi:polysaccharide deacetylase family protein [Sporosarcina aquimarina]|uniref:Polysaccharide deacetylase family protein n=1 Tax=Sporosarcina aquimarina TaxID=114975 RepID=A0ABU4G157_9BACL|nr:polysaccharide deacetylase family protein [Sporosarcina aquimarina]MDW0110686.1 polysaccharide deacetylase family protein [Sporosarcina aquimarina]